MPRGEHFKKDNPRINQVSFKVNDSELVKLKEIANSENVSIAVWLRNQILKPQPTKDNIITTGKVENQAPKSSIVKAENKGSKKPEVKKAKNYDKPTVKNEQMSMF